MGTYDFRQIISRPTEVHPEICENCRCAFLYTARSVEDETRNDRRNANRNPEWWGDFSQLQN